MATGPTLAEISQEIEVLETLDAFASELGDFTARLSTYSGQNPGALANDPTIAFELGQLKNLAKELSSTLADADEVLGKGPGVADQITSVVTRLDQLADFATRSESLTGPERLAAMGEFVNSIESIATALTGLGSLNPVIGVFISLYGTALASAANTAAYLETIQAEKLDVVARTDGINDQAEDIASQATPPPDPAVLRAQQEAQARLEELYAERAREIAVRDANEVKRARDHCARVHRAQLDEAAKTASRLDFTGHLTTDGMDGDAAGALEAWLAAPQAGMAEALAAASQAGDAALTAEVAARARHVMEIKRQVGSLMRDYRDCVDSILEHGYQLPSSAVAAGGAAGAAGVASSSGPSRQVLALAGAGLLAATIAGIAIASGGSSDTSPASSDDSVADGAASDAVAAADPVAACPGAGQRAGELVLSSPVMQDGGLIPEPYRSSTWEQGHLSPPLSWSGVPEAATELGIIVVGSGMDDFAAVASDPDPWARPTDGGMPVGYRGDRKWIVTGIDPSLDGLPELSYEGALAAGLTLQPLGVESTLPGSDEWVSGFFVSPTTSSQLYLFTLFAMCEPDHESGHAYVPGWFTEHALDYAWFTASAG